MKLSLFIISAIVIAAIIIFGALIWYIGNKSRLDTKVRSDVILVLGGHVIAGTDCVGPICKQKGFVPHPHYNPCVLARVDHAVSLYKEGFASKILMSGGTDKETNANEAETMKKMAMESGVPETDILLEKESTSTYENLLLSQKIISNAHLSSVIIVTEPYHNARADLVAAKLGYKYALSPTMTSPCWNDKNLFANWNFLKREALALIAYKLIHKI